jgi:hypothetical protein
MTIDPKDLRTLLLRVTLVTFAVRLVPLMSNDLGPSEAATTMGLGLDGPSGEWLAHLAHGWLAAAGGLGLVARVPALLCDLALPLLAVAFARAAGWGAICGLLGGLVLAIAPLGIEAGHRLDGGSVWALVALGALVLLRRGLTDADVPKVLASAALLVLGGLLGAPVLVVVPAGLYLAVRTIAVGPHKTAALLGWTLAPIVALALRYALFGFLVPEPDAAAHWLATPHLAGEPSGWATVGLLPAFLQGLLAPQPGGLYGALAGQLGILAAPLWALAVGGLLTLAALVGVVRGQVRPDPPPLPKQTPPPVRSPLAMAPELVEDLDDGAGARDGWRTLGVALPMMPRTLGDRDIVPLLLGILGAAVYVAQAGARGVPDGLQAALAVGRVCTALLLGVGLTALAMPRRARTESETIVARRRFNFGLGAVALLVFALGAVHLMAVAKSPDRIAARKVTQHARESLNAKGALLAIGPRGLPIAFLLDPLGQYPLVRVTSLDPPHAVSGLVALLVKHPKTLQIAGDRDVLVDPGEGQPDAELVTLGRTLDESLQLSGQHPVFDAAVVLGGTAGVRYTRESQALSPETIRPQLGPGQHP